MKSIIQNKKECYVCNTTCNLHDHHIIYGTSNRKQSEKYGLKVRLCHECHTGKNGAQYDPEKNKQLKMDAQAAFEKTHTHSEWMKLFGKNYL